MEDVGMKRTIISGKSSRPWMIIRIRIGVPAIRAKPKIAPSTVVMPIAVTPPG